MLAVCSSCSTTHYVPLQAEYNAAFVGKSHNYIVSFLGAPDRETSDGAGGSILIYEDSYSTTSGSAIMIPTPYSVYIPNVTNTTYLTLYTQLYIDRSGNCYCVKTNRTRTEKEFSAGKTFGLFSSIIVLFIALLSAE